MCRGKTYFNCISKEKSLTLRVAFKSRDIGHILYKKLNFINVARVVLVGSLYLNVCAQEKETLNSGLRC